MRLWHSDLLQVLPTKLLIQQRVDCTKILVSLKSKDDLNDTLVNRILNFPLDHFKWYCKLVIMEMYKRHLFNTGAEKRRMESLLECDKVEDPGIVPFTSEYDSWFDYRYLFQCIIDLQEQYDCDMITDDDWRKIRLNIH